MNPIFIFLLSVTPPPPSGGLTGANIAGIVIGSIAVVAMVVITYLTYRCIRKDQQEEAAQSLPSHVPNSRQKRLKKCSIFNLGEQVYKHGFYHP